MKIQTAAGARYSLPAYNHWASVKVGGEVGLPEPRVTWSHALLDVSECSFSTAFVESGSIALYPEMGCVNVILEAGHLHGGHSSSDLTPPPPLTFWALWP